MLGACVVKLDTHAQHVAAVGFAYAISLLERAIIQLDRVAPYATGERACLSAI